MTEPDRTVALRPILDADVDRVAEFLHRQLNGRLSPETWAAAMRPPWHPDSPNHGFMLVAGDSVVGAYLTFYSVRDIHGRAERFCNLAAWCVVEKYRSHGLRLLRGMLSQEGYTFTDLSPSGNVIPLNLRLDFQHLDTASAIVVNLPWPAWLTPTRLITDPALIEAHLSGRDLEIYRDHRDAAAAYHLVAERDGQCCYVMARKDRRKNLPLFGSILHVGNPDLFRDVARHVCSHLLVRFGILATLMEKRVVRDYPRFSIPLRRPRPRMFRSSRLQPAQVDYLYSELTCVPW